MRAWDIVTALDKTLDANDTKIHLARTNEWGSNPLDEFRQGTFERWQASQKNKNFERSCVVSLIALPEADHWLFAGAFDSLGCTGPNMHGRYTYRLRPRPASKDLVGRMIAILEDPGRQSYQLAHKLVGRIELSQISDKPRSIPEFPGFKKLIVTKPLLDDVVAHNHAEWKAILSSVAGVYLISDPGSGKLYVGSATGQGGIWQRWRDYVSTGHGGNTELKALLRRRGAKHFQTLEFSILEIADIHANRAEIQMREEHWKRVLLTREHGLN